MPMHDSKHYTEQAQRFARLAAQAPSAQERDGYARLAAGYLQLAKDAASMELRAARDAAAPEDKEGGEA